MGKKLFMSADSGYQGAQNREELKGFKADWLIAEMPRKVRLLKKHPIRTEYLKASIRAKVEHPFLIIKLLGKLSMETWRRIRTSL